MPKRRKWRKWDKKKKTPPPRFEVAVLPDPVPWKEPREPLYRFTVRAGTECDVRKADGEDFRPYTTTRTLRFDGYAERNGLHFTFVRDGWAIRVRLRDMVMDF
jgi:hypothetical protein